ncbi:MAG: FeoC-like transcriptional regulator [Pseudomonadota bacterium]|nr:FeoC-like transcriptional regulator [Pseudomonadota bacterium]
MILSDLTTYLAEQKCVALIDLSHHFGSDPEALRGMLAVLERKGRVRKLPSGTACGGGCTKCDPASIELYEWIEAE